MNIYELYEKAFRFEFLSVDEGIFLFENAALTELMFVANELRKQQVPHGKVTWQIDRNVNTTNVCIANCKFCNFYRIPGHPDAYITDIETYKTKIEQTFKWGGDQLLLQGGHHPELGLEFYTSLFRKLKELYPTLKLHTLGPPEIAHITKLAKSTHREVLTELRKAGMDSLPGAGAEILVDRVRRLISKGKCGSQEWLDIMREARARGEDLHRVSLRPWQHRDLRRTARTIFAEQLKVPTEVAEHCLAHVMRKIERTYNRYQYADEKREAFEALSNYIEALVSPAPEGGNVIPMRR